MDREKLVKEAKEWLGTPWMHHQALKKVGCDCVGFLSSISRNAGFELPPFENHGYYPVNDELKKYLDKFLYLSGSIDNIEKGDVLLFKFTGVNSHVGVATEIGVIHACPFQKKVVEHRIDSRWEKRLVGVYKWERHG